MMSTDPTEVELTNAKTAVANNNKNNNNNNNNNNNETKEDSYPHTFLDQHKKNYKYWEDSLIKLGYEHGHHSFLVAPITKEGKTNKPLKKNHSFRLRTASAIALQPRSQKKSLFIEGESAACFRDNLLFQFFDVTPNRLRRLFHYWDKDGDGSIGIDEFLDGLKSQNLDITSDTNKIEKIKIDIAALFGVNDYNQLKVTFKMFSTFFHRTKMALLFYEPLRRMVYVKIRGHELFLSHYNVSESSSNSSNMGSLTKPPTYIPTAEILIVDYNKEIVKIGCSNPDSDEIPIPFTLENEDSKKYFFGSRENEFTMRWVSIMKPDPISVITIAVKYRLHPLALEDMLQLNLQRPKVDKYDMHYFVVFPALRLTNYAYDMIDESGDSETIKWNINNPNLYELWDDRKNKNKDKEDEKTLVEMQNYCLCVAGPNYSEPKFSFDTVISVEAGFAPIIPIRTGKMKVRQKVGLRHRSSKHSGTAKFDHYKRIETYNGGTHHPEEDGGVNGGGAFRSDLFRMLGTDFSRLRMQRSIFMMYQIINSSVEKIGPILEMYKKRLDWYTYQIRKQRWKFGERIRGLLDTKRELELLKEYLRPCIGVIRHIINDKDLAPKDIINRNEDDSDSDEDDKNIKNGKSNKSSGTGTSYQRRSFRSSSETRAIGESDRLLKRSEIKQYFEDIDDKLQLYVENLQQMADLCDSYNGEFTAYGDKRMNDILFVLTIVTTLFVPAQFFTGLWGMNFVKKDGSPNMPLLNWQYGYLFFWCLSLGLTFLTFLVLLINGWMPCQQCNRCAENFGDGDD